MNLSGFNLSGAKFGTTPGAPVPEKTWTNGLDETNFSGANLSGAWFSDADASSANFTGANFANATISNMTFAGNRTANLSTIKTAYASDVSGVGSAPPPSVQWSVISKAAGANTATKNSLTSGTGSLSPITSAVTVLSQHDAASASSSVALKVLSAIRSKTEDADDNYGERSSAKPANE